MNNNKNKYNKNKYNKKCQHGTSLISLVLVLVLSLFAVTTTIKLMPIYIENFTVKSSLESIASEINENKIKPKDIKDRLMQRLGFNNITGISKENIMISGGEKHSTLIIQYEVRKPIVGNVDVVMSFNNSQAINL